MGGRRRGCRMAPIVSPGSAPPLALDQQNPQGRSPRYRRPMAIRVECHAGYRGERDVAAFTRAAG